MDLADRAAQDQEFYESVRIVPKYEGVSPDECDDCLEPIEPARKKSIPGTRLCACCAQIQYELNKHIRR